MVTLLPISQGWGKTKQLCSIDLTHKNYSTERQKNTSCFETDRLESYRSILLGVYDFSVKIKLF